MKNLQKQRLKFISCIKNTESKEKNKEMKNIQFVSAGFF